MIEVRIRHIDQGESVRLMDWPAEDLDGALRLVTTWGVRFEEDSTEYAQRGSFSGEIVVDEGRAFFEILVNDNVEGPDA